MLIVTKKGQTEALTHYTGYELFEEVNGALTLSLTSFSVDENPGHILLEEEALITVEDGREFRIKQMSATRNKKQIKAISTFFDLAGVQKKEMFAGTKNFHTFINWVMQDTGWLYDIEGIPFTSKLVPNFGNTNVLKLIEILLDEWNIERQILPDKRVVFSQLLGPDNDAQYRYGHNVKTLSKSVDTTNLKTSVTAYGGNGLMVKYTSPNAYLYPDAGEMDSFSDDRFLIGENLLEEAKSRLVDYPDVTIELEALELTEKALGERVWLIYDESLGLEFQTRILAKTTREPKEKSSAVIGSTLPKTLSDQLIDQSIQIDENAKQSESHFEQTNERITLEVTQLGGDIDEAKASLVIEATNIRAEVTQLRSYADEELGEVREEASANFSILAGSITQSVQTSKSYTDSEIGEVRQENTADFSVLSGRINGKAESSTVNSLGTRVNGVEFDLNAIEGVVSTKVSQTDYNGNTIASLINQTATTIDIQASKINLIGAVNVLSDLSGNLGSITAGTIIGTTIRLDNGGLLDLRSGTILWGSNVPQADYAETAGNANLLNGAYTYRDFSLIGHNHSIFEYVKPKTGQGLQLWRNGTKVRVYQGNAYTELTGITGSD